MKPLLLSISGLKIIIFTITSFIVYQKPAFFMASPVTGYSSFALYHQKIQANQYRHYGSFDSRSVNHALQQQ
ncbi:hypothetical protein MKY30_09165 [Oceanobacillus sp. FSL W8-0428]|uniref:hypothetical protein n=1 Tax=Oceanobacillus TaxID=182709 RepID=UPI000AFCA827